MIDQALLDRVQKQAWFHRYPRGWPLVLFVIASIITASAVIAIERADRLTRRVELDRNLTEISSALQRRVTENIALLRAGAALFATQDTVSAQQFEEFADDLQGKGNLYGSLGMGWVPLVPAGQLPAFEAAMRAGGRPEFFTYPRPDGSARFASPIVFLQPGTPDNRRAIGYNMYSEPVRRAAMEEAVKLDRPVASRKVHLIQDRGSTDAETAGFLIYMPVVQDSGPRRQVKGFVYSPFRAETFLKSASELYRNDHIGIAIYDGLVSEDTLLARRRVDGENGPAMERKIDVGNHTWIVQVSERQSGALSTLSRIILFFGLLASLMVMALGRIITRRAAEDRRALEWFTSQAAIRNSLTRELNHRVKNTLANVLSIAALTRRRATDIDDFTESLTARIRALSATHDLLSQSDWGNAAIGDIVRSELAPYMEGDENHVEMGGPDIKLAPNDAMSLGLAIHELVTNAAKYGALSTTDGKIHVRWTLQSPDAAEVSWREEGGPPVVEPSKRGFGRDLIEKIVAHELKSEVHLTFAPEGVRCSLRVPVRAAREFNLRTERARRNP